MGYEVIIEIKRKGETDEIELILVKDITYFDEDDEYSTKVGPGDTVKWQLAENSGLHSLENIEKTDKREESVDVFDNDPHEVDNSVFAATIKSPSLGIGKFSTYAIEFKITSDSKTLKLDPKLIMKVSDQ